MKERSLRAGACIGYALLWLCFFSCPRVADAVTAAEPQLRVLAAQSNGWVRIQGNAHEYCIIRLEASSNLVHWQTIAELHNFSFEFADPVSARTPQRFYRFSKTSATLTNHLKNQVYGRYEIFADGGEWVKFAILTDDPTRVYYAHSGAYLFHYDFVTNYLEGFRGMDPDTFDEVSLYNAGRKVLLGAVLFPPPDQYETFEYGIQFVSHDPLPPELVRDMFSLVRSTVAGSFFGLYMPSYEQARAAEADRAWFVANGVPVSSPERWAVADACYSLGWAVGTLKYFGADDIQAAYADGRLGPGDVLLTDSIPAEVPYVAGIITLTPATLNAHAIILARSQHVPVVYLWDAAERERVVQLAGRQVAFQSSRFPGPGDPREIEKTCKVDIHALDAGFDPALMASILASRNPPPINLQPVARYGAYTAPVDNLLPADTRFFGGKAANYGLLRRTIPSNAPPAIAVSFDLWLEFMTQTMNTGNTLRQEISNRLSGLSYPVDINRIQTNLDGVRSLIRQNTQFTAEQQQAIIAALGVFDPLSNIRFRSSSNVEDSETFTGAGLYDSYSGCLSDDLDGDGRGPSHCDPTEEDERGVFRAIRRVFASFYNNNAYLERLRRGVNENEVGMALLVHHSTPDAYEMANGVATVTTDLLHPMFTSALVSQVGAISVANPETNARPEIVEALVPEPHYDISLYLRQSSSLFPLGNHVMTWPEDYRELTRLLVLVRDGYREMTREAGRFILDFEYKKVQPGELQIKQVRELPLAENTNRTSTFLLNSPTEFVSYQGLGRQVFASHRLKFRWTLRTTNTRLGESNLTSSPHVDFTIEHLNGARIETLSGRVQSFPNYSNHVVYVAGGFISRDSWRMNSLEGPVDLELETMLPSVASPLASLVTIRDARMYVTATYDHPVTYVPRRSGELSTTNRETLRLVRAPQMVGSPIQPSETTIEFWVGRTNFNFTIASVGGRLESRIEGFTTEPVVLTNYFSQTMDQGHMGGGPEWILEPRIEPGISARTLTELDAREIRMFYVLPRDRKTVLLFGGDGRYRRLASHPGTRMTVAVTESDSPPFPPVGSTYTMSFDNFNYTLVYSETNIVRGTFSYSRQQNTAGMWTDGAIVWSFTFDGPDFGTFHRKVYREDGAGPGERGTFRIE